MQVSLYRVVYIVRRIISVQYSLVIYNSQLLLGTGGEQAMFAFHYERAVSVRANKLLRGPHTMDVCVAATHVTV